LQAFIEKKERMMTEAMAKTHIQQLMETSNEVDELCNRKTVVPGIVQARFLQEYCFKKKDFYRYTLILGWKKKKGKRGDKERVKNQRILCGGEKKKSIAYYYQLKNSL